VRLTAPRLLHDRMIIVDGREVWALSQSVKDFAKRAHASLLRVDAEVSALKVQAYEDLWKNAQKIV